MSVDLVSNMISSIRNASLVNKDHVEVPYSKECEAVAKVLSDNGYLGDVKSFKESGKSFKKLRIDLNYDEFGNSLITKIQRVSTPGRRIYRGADDLGKFMNGFGIYVVSTSRGVMTGDIARNKRLGGELICKVY